MEIEKLLTSDIVLPLEYALALSQDRHTYFRNHPCVFTWEQLYAAALPNKAKILAAERRAKNRADRAAQRASRSLAKSATRRG